ncbi:hypothetical protein SAMN05421823_11510 [Catalinimonas alkaloidigena]|uniref:Uncharacterized protein n=1 Tax=Catalinimonas alkaloidigena TaxID=1075417 RepID=A0A1G9TW06_9BACT|nr:hypothetical protein [Catalinimonas alkaloidigena]SDM51867.1 hypothetical protein SAMN05421823_11510 [Catalinimonas alkaloidigena]
MLFFSRRRSSVLTLTTALGIALFFSQAVGAQTTPYSDQMNQVFGALNQAPLSTGILTDFGLDLTDPAPFDGQRLDATSYMDADAWHRLYGTLLSSVINPQSKMVHLSTLNRRLDSLQTIYATNANPPIDLTVMNILYQSLKPDAVES